MKGLTPSYVVLCHFILFFIPLVEALCDYILRALLFRSALPDQTGPPHELWLSPVLLLNTIRHNHYFVL